MLILKSQKKTYQKIKLFKALLPGRNVATSDGLDMAGQSSEQIEFLY